MGAQLQAGQGGAGGAPDRGDQSFAGDGVGQGRDAGFQDVGVFLQDPFDLGGVDGDAADLDLEVGASGQVQGAGVVASDEVAGAEPAAVVQARGWPVNLSVWRVRSR